jgi:IS5 family transposase
MLFDKYGICMIVLSEVIMPDFDKFGFADIEIEDRFKEPTYLDVINKFVNWKRQEKILGKFYTKDKNKVGNPAYPALLMLKILYVQKWENLSDPQMEFALRDRISVIRFVGFPLSSPTPDHSTICRFRNNLVKSGAFDALLEDINNQLIEHGFIVQERKTALVDATLVSSARPKGKCKDVQEDRKEDEGGIDNSDKSKNNNNISYSNDVDAKWLKKGNKYVYGYKAFFSTDINGFILGNLIKPANVSEVNTFEEFLEKLSFEAGTNILADKGYAFASNRAYLNSKGYNDFIMHKKPKGKKMSEFLKLFNRYASKYRFKIEQVFGLLKKDFGFNRFRYLGLQKVQAESTLISIAFNLRRASFMIS